MVCPRLVLNLVEGGEGKEARARQSVRLRTPLCASTRSDLTSRLSWPHHDLEVILPSLKIHCHLMPHLDKSKCWHRSLLSERPQEQNGNGSWLYLLHGRLIRGKFKLCIPQVFPQSQLHDSHKSRVFPFWVKDACLAILRKRLDGHKNGVLQR